MKVYNQDKWDSFKAFLEWLTLMISILVGYFWWLPWLGSQGT